MSYADIEKIYGNTVNRNRRITLNGNNYVSLLLHEDNPEEVNLKMYKEFDGDVENAFHGFIIQEPSIVLNERIK